MGLLKIVDARPSKGKLRLSFVCGKRAFRDYRRVYDLAHAAAAELSTAVENLPGAVTALRAHLREAEHTVSVLRREQLLGSVPSLLESAPRAKSGVRVVAETVAADMPLLRDLATAIIRQGSAIALLAAPQGKAISSSSHARRAWGRTWARCFPPAPANAAARVAASQISRRAAAPSRCWKRPARACWRDSGARLPDKAARWRGIGGITHAIRLQVRHL